MNKRDKKMIELLLVILMFIGVYLACLYVAKKDEKLMREGRPIMATIEYIRPISTDESGNTTVAYVIDVEGRTIKGRRKIDTFYAPQLQPGEKIKIIYKDDKNYMFIFNNESE